MGSFFKDLFIREFVKSETRFHELNYLFWECTTRCNLHCLHCGSDCAQSSRFEDMPLADFLKALDTIKEKPKPFTVVLTGGEPLLRKDLAECGRQIRARGFGWSMVSNGFLFDKAMRDKVVNAGMGALTFSLDGLQEEHNWLRNHPQSFARVTQAISLAAEIKHLNFDIVTCVNQRNIEQLPAIARLLESLGVKAWRLFTIIPIGRATSNPQLLLQDSQFRYLMDFIASRRKETHPMQVNFSCEGYVGPYERVVRDGPFFCRAGINIASVLIDGSIGACPNNDRKFIQGNIYKDNLWDIWQTGFKPYRDRSWTRTGPCADCKQFKNCLGNGFHNWHGDCLSPLVCHYSKLKH